MKPAVYFGAAMLGCVGFAANQFTPQSEAYVAPATPAVRHFHVFPRTFAQPNPLAKVNELLQVYGFRGVEAPAPPPGYRYLGTILARVTAYEPSEVSCGGSADGKTSTLKNAWRMDGCAVDPEAISYGTMVWIPGIGWRVADDTGAAMKRSWRRKGIYHIDVRVPTVWQARRFGDQSQTPVMLCVPDGDAVQP